MKSISPSTAAFVRLRLIVSAVLALGGVMLAASIFFPRQAVRHGPTLAALKTDLVRQPSPGGLLPQPNPVVPPTTSSITFGHPVITGIQGTGYEQDLRLDPSNPNRLYTSVPASASANTSWMWRSLDAGKTFKWVPNAAALAGKVTTCNGGGDTELGVDLAGHLYFNDLTLANFSTARSDDFGATFTCSNTGVPDTAVDRQWYAIDGDPTNGGSIYLANDEIGPGGVMCGGSVGNNVLVMYRSPAAAAVGATAGVTFGPANHVSAVLSCDEAIMGNNELSPVATTLGQPNTVGGGFATLSAPVKHIFVVHDNAVLTQIRIGRCFPVAFGAPVANVSDPSGLNCTDILVADLGPTVKTGGDFPTMAIDSAGNLYTVWEQAPIDASGNVVGDTVLRYSYSTDQGNTWAAPIAIDTSGSPVGTLHNNVFAWMAAGDDGRVNIAWYGTNALSNPNDQTCGVNAPMAPAQGKNVNGPDSVNGLWSLWLVQTLNGHAASPTFTAPIEASGHFSHRGNIQTLLGGQCGDRTLGDFMQLRTGPFGEAEIGYGETNNLVGNIAAHGMFVRQISGNGLYAATSPINIAGLQAFNGATDPSGDATLDANGTTGPNTPALDLVRSSIARVTTAPCSVGAPCYRMEMQLSNFSIATPAAPYTDLVWSTQWFVPSTTDARGGKNFHAYAESFNGSALQCYVGENAVTPLGGGVSMTYPGNTALPGANCQSVTGPNGTIAIYVPLSMVAEPDPLDSRLHEVTASTMTLTQPANTTASLGGIGGSLFNLIDVVQDYLFDPAELKITSITRLTNGHIVLQCVGSPNHLNTIATTADMLTPFTPLTSVLADASGLFQFEDTDAGNFEKRFYRLTLP